MSDFTAVPLDARAYPACRTSRIVEARLFLGGLLFTAAVAVAGTALVVVTLVIGVVGAPIIAAALAYAVVRHRRGAGARLGVVEARRPGPLRGAAGAVTRPRRSERNAS